MVVKEGYRHAGIDVNTEEFELDSDNEDEDVEVFTLGSFNRRLDEMMASFTEHTPRHNHPPTLGSYTPISPLPPSPQHRNIPQQQWSPLVQPRSPPTPVGHMQHTTALSSINA